MIAKYKLVAERMRSLTSTHRWVLTALLACSCAQWQMGPADIDVPQETRFAEVDGWRLHIRLEGDHGPPVVLLHGYSSTLFEWMSVAPAICAHHRCLLVDLPGFGWSDKREGDYSPSALAGFVLAVMQQQGFDSAHIIAHSWGAAIALALAYQHPERVRSLVLVGAWVYYEQLTSFMKWARVPGLGEFLFTLFFDEQPEMRYEQVYHEPELHVREEDVVKMKRFLKRRGVKRAALQAARDQELEKMARYYPEINHPALLIWGEEDKVSLPFYGHRLAGDLQDSQLVFLPRCGHVPHHEATMAFASHVLTFLQASKRKGTQLQTAADTRSEQ